MEQNQPQGGGQMPQGQMGQQPPMASKKSRAGIIIAIVIIVAVVVAGIIWAIFKFGADQTASDQPASITPPTTTTPTQPTTPAAPAANLPPDVPVYANATVVSSATLGGRINVAFKTSDSYSEVLSFYETDLAAEGWKNISRVELGATRVVSADKNGREFTVTITESPEGASFNVSVTQ